VGSSDGFRERVCNTEGYGVGLAVGDSSFGDTKVPPPHQQQASFGLPIPASQQSAQLEQPLLSLRSYQEQSSPYESI